MNSFLLGGRRTRRTPLRWTRGLCSRRGVLGCMAIIAYPVVRRATPRGLHPRSQVACCGMTLRKHGMESCLAPPPSSRLLGSNREWKSSVQVRIRFGVHEPCPLPIADNERGIRIGSCFCSSTPERQHDVAVVGGRKILQLHLAHRECCTGMPGFVPGWSSSVIRRQEMRRVQ